MPALLPATLPCPCFSRANSSDYDLVDLKCLVGVFYVRELEQLHRLLMFRVSRVSKSDL